MFVAPVGRLVSALIGRKAVSWSGVLLGVLLGARHTKKRYKRC
jgi:hypothetical protein